MISSRRTTIGTADFASFTWLGQNTTGCRHTANVQSGNNRVHQLKK
jgi:hypothetical protein